MTNSEYIFYLIRCTKHGVNALMYLMLKVEGYTEASLLSEDETYFDAFGGYDSWLKSPLDHNFWINFSKTYREETPIATNKTNDEDNNTVEELNLEEIMTLEENLIEFLEDRGDNYEDYMGDLSFHFDKYYDGIRYGYRKAIEDLRVFFEQQKQENDE